MICCCTNWYGYERFRGIPVFMWMQDSITISSAVRTAEFASPAEMALRRSTQVSRFLVYYPPGWYRVNKWCLSCGLFAYMTLYFTFSSEGTAPRLDVLAGTFHYHSHNAPSKWGGGVTQSALIKRWCKGAVEEGGEIKSVLNGMSQFYCSARVVVEG